MCTFGVLGLSCASPGGPEAAGVSHDSRAHFRVPAFKNTTKIQREDPQERERRMEIVAGERKKRAKFWGGPGEGCPAESCPAEGCPAEGCPAEGCPAEGCPAEGCPAEGLGFRVRVQGSFLG